jgi:hypothetical protein
MALDVGDGFKTFLTRLEPSAIEMQKATKHKSSVKACLEKNFECYSMIETGSIGNGTGIKRYSDTDYFATIPVKVLTDDSAYFLRKLKTALKETFPSTSGIEVNSPAVVIPFGIYASENLEVTPCNYSGMIDTTVGKFPKYTIPDGSGGWMASSPQAHNKYVDNLNDKLSGKLKPVIKFIKAWKFMQGVPLISFYVELRVAKFMSESIILSYDEAVYKTLLELHRVNLAAIRDPMGISGLISSTKTESQLDTAFSKLNTAVRRAEKAYEARLSGKLDTAFYYWKLLFTDNFPSR